MKAYQVPDEWMIVAVDAWRSAPDGEKFSSTLAAVAPRIAAAERERVAKWHDRQTEEATARAEDAKTRGETGNVLHHARFAAAHHISAAAIRALSDATDTAPAPTRNAGHLENAASPRPR